MRISRTSASCTEWIDGGSYVRAIARKNLNLINTYLLDVKWVKDKRYHRVDGPAHFRAYTSPEVANGYLAVKLPSELDIVLSDTEHLAFCEWFVKGTYIRIKSPNPSIETLAKMLKQEYVEAYHLAVRDIVRGLGYNDSLIQAMELL